jgi:subtilisin family serine protease
MAVDGTDANFYRTFCIQQEIFLKYRANRIFGEFSIMCSESVSSHVGVRWLALLFFLGLLVSSFSALAQGGGDPELALGKLAARENVGNSLVAALREKQEVRVFVAMQDSSPDTGRRNRVLNSAPVGSFRLNREFRNVSGFAVTANAAAIEAMSRQPGVWRIDLDEGGSGHALQALPLSRLDVVKAGGYSGEGITVAVVDSGIDTDHPDLSDNLVGEQCFCSGGPCCPNGQPSQSGPGAAEDDHGHGTHVSGIITSNGVAAPEGGAPETDIVAIKVLDSNNSFCCSSDVIAALDWIISERPDVDVVNMSLGTSARFPGDCDSAVSWIAGYAAAINILRERGVPVFASSGNNSSGVDMGVPACVGNTISVGAVWDSDVGPQNVFCAEASTAADQVTCFSNASTTTDLFAPGAPYTSAGLNGGTITYYGTSQASPTAAACAALILEAKPGIPIDELEANLKDSPVQVTDATNGLSYPRLDCQAAISALYFRDGFEATP